MNAHSVEILARQRYAEFSADARGDRTLGRAELASEDGSRPSASDTASLVRRLWLGGTVRRFRSMAHEANGGPPSL